LIYWHPTINSQLHSLDRLDTNGNNDDQGIMADYANTKDAIRLCEVIIRDAFGEVVCVSFTLVDTLHVPLHLPGTLPLLAYKLRGATNPK